MSIANRLTYQEFAGFAQTIYGAGVSGASELASRIGELQTIARNAALTETQKYVGLANQSYRQCQNYAEAAAEYAQRAEAALNQRVADVCRRFGDAFEQIANQPLGLHGSGRNSGGIETPCFGWAPTILLFLVASTLSRIFFALLP